MLILIKIEEHVLGTYAGKQLPVIFDKINVVKPTSFHLAADLSSFFIYSPSFYSVFECFTVAYYSGEPTGENLSDVQVEFSVLSSAVFVMSVIEWHKQERPHLELKT